MKLYSYWRSSSSWRVRIALHLKQVPFTYEAVHLLEDGGAQNTDAYRQKNPLRTVPLLEWEEGGVTRRLPQSLAIIAYLDDRYPEPRLLPADPFLRAQAWALAELPNSGIQPLQNLAVLQRVKDELKGDDKAWAAHWNQRGLSALEAQVAPLAGRFCLGDSLTIADVCLVPQLYSARRFGVDLSAFPTLTRIEAACAQMDAFARAHPDRQPDAQV
jgi:maleylpyruvate isomerase